MHLGWAGHSEGPSLLLLLGGGVLQPRAEALALGHLPPSRGGAQHELHLAWLQEHLRGPLVGGPSLRGEGRLALGQGLQAVPAPAVLILPGGRVDVGVGLLIGGNEGMGGLFPK